MPVDPPARPSTAAAAAVEKAEGRPLGSPSVPQPSLREVLDTRTFLLTVSVPGDISDDCVKALCKHIRRASWTHPSESSIRAIHPNHPSESSIRVIQPGPHPLELAEGAPGLGAAARRRALSRPPPEDCRPPPRANGRPSIGYARRDSWAPLAPPPH